MKRMYCREIRESYVQEAEVAGWIHDIRNLGGIAFILLRDRTGILQLTLLKKPNKELFKHLTTLTRESVIRTKGKVQRSEKVMNGFEILPESAEVLSVAAVPLPLGVADKVESELDTRLDNRFLDLRKKEVRKIFYLRSLLLKSVRRTLENEEFIETHTPKIVAAATEGGTELFPFRYFEREAYLNQSPQLYKQILMSTGFDRVYEIGPAFRAEGHDTVRHLNEFTSIDIEMAFSNHHDVMDLLERVIVEGYETVRKEAPELMEGMNIPENVEAFPRITYTEALDIAKKKGLRIEWGEDLSMEALRLIAGESPDLYFITDWPDAIKPFYAMPGEDDRTCRSFDLMYREKEVTSGAQRVHDYELLKKRIADRGLDIEDFGFYLNAFKYGMPPHAGWGLGAERWVMTVAGLENIREAVLFPRDMHRLVP
ncbi:MAG: aspartate--tRNA(Asn) ligase [Thermoplasmata archaeon]|nr:aspartate--tRNA(Asn) ligase [Thermoplasmata archaeon]